MTRMSTTAPNEGYSVAECVLVMAMLATTIAAVAPPMSGLVDAARGRQAAGYLASRFRLARQQAALASAATAIVFDVSAGHWLFRVCRDGNGNGVRRDELGNIDSCFEEPYDVTALFPGIRIERDPAIPDPGGGPGSGDPILFGASDMLSFSAAGSSTSGTLFVLSEGGVQFAIRVLGATGRTRVLRYESNDREWREV